MESTDMGEARRRQLVNPLYGAMGKQELVVSPRWVVYRGVLFLVGAGDSIACLPASNMLPPLNEEQVAALEAIIAENPQLGAHTEQGTAGTTSIDVVENTQT